ncbi:GLPGLI family protein [Chryseobacterium sp. H1D6B]|uniref:GLPGLI family protein n=1 Tax=Chryseobacterium sp. H1D6B TaxID=2940588 RepID=UPI0015C8066B|nr:GLPGLI family protein [Chryseobacterium sp. H1D6B]MDH6252801.1 GLPGLI family protein [Chryseobacterium sp. H1D6B]
MVAVLLLLICCFEGFSQSITTDFAAAYDVEYPIYKKKNTEQFLLYINSKENISYYKSTNQYVLDSLKKEGKISGSDFMDGSKYDTALKEEVLRKNDSFTVYEKIVDAKIKYIEPESLKWTILKDTKTYSGYKTRKAFTYAYGRKWIAWYAEDLPLNYGPYKFCGLPGLIVNIYDEKAAYFFTLKIFKKKIKQVQLPKDNTYKKISKIKAKQISSNSLTDISGMVFDDPNEKRRMQKVIEKMVSESPRIDIE